MSAGTKAQENKLRETLFENPADWETRKELAHLLYDQGSFADAAELIWQTDEIPSIDVELAFAARILAKGAPRKAIRLLTALLEHNRGKAVQNLGMANALMHHGMVLQATRFYGAALEADPELGNPDLEHFILWTDDEETLWGNFGNRRPILGDLPWMKRDPKEAMKLTSRISTHTTPIKLPSLKEASGEKLKNELYQQKAEKGADPSPPPAVTIPMDRVAPKDRLFDKEMGAEAPVDQAELVLEAVEAQTPPAQVKKELAKPDFGAATAATAAAAAKPAPMSPPPGGAVKPTLPPAGPPVKPTVPPPGGVPRPTAPPVGGAPKPSLPAVEAAPVATLPMESLDDLETVPAAPPSSKPKVGLPPLKK